MASLEIRGPPTFLTLPPEIRNYIYSLSGCLQLSRVTDCRTNKFEVVFSPTIRAPMKCTKCYDWNFPPLGTESPTPLSLWINRKSAPIHYAQGMRPLVDVYLERIRLRKIRVHCEGAAGEMCAAFHAMHIDSTAETALTKVNKQIRQETLPIFYGSQSFLLTLFDRASDCISIFKWLRTIGKQNASSIRTIKIVYRKKKDRRYIQEALLKSMRKLGVSTEAREGVVMAIRLEYPFCYCESCIRNLLGEG